MPKTMRRELLQLANTYDANKHKIAGRYISEKLDGGRCFWDGGITRGIPTLIVPWAGLRDPKTGERKDKIKPAATGLWSRYGNRIMAPDWFLNTLPTCPLDGELWLGRGKFQATMSAIRKDRPIDSEWKPIQYAVYSSPPMDQLFATGEIKNAQMWADIDLKKCGDFVAARVRDLDYGDDFKFVSPGSSFEAELSFLQAYLETQNDRVFMHRQVRLPGDEDAARAAADNFIAGILDKGGEGAIIRDSKAMWTPRRHNGLLKFKPFSDSEATVVGFYAGEEGKQGNCLGKIGALIVKFGEIEFKIGGGLKPNAGERDFADEVASKHAAANPGERMPAGTQGKHFRIGQNVTFKFRELSDDGVPKEARFWRVREDD